MQGFYAHYQYYEIKSLIYKMSNQIKSHMTTSLIKVPSQKIPVPKITMQTKSHNLNFNVLSSVVDSSGDEV